MTASLIVAGFETYDKSVQRPYQLAGLGWIRGEGLPDQTTIEQKYLDGDAVSGDRSLNRSVRIPVWVFGVNALDLAANVAALWQAVTAATFTVQWTPNGGLPVIYDCFKASVTQPNNVALAEQGVAAVMIDCQAMPFGRSPDQLSVSAVPPPQLQIDSFDTAPTGATLDTGTKFEGTGSASFTLTKTGSVYTNATPVSRTYAAKNLSTFSSLSLRFLQAALSGSVSVSVTLGSAAGSTKYVSASTSSSAAGSWALVTLPLTGGTPVSGSGVDLTAVTSESITVTLTSFFFFAGSTVAAHIDDLRASAGSSVLISTTRGAVLAMPAILGAARAPVSLALSGTTMATALMHSPPVDQDSNAAILISTGVAASPSNVTATVAAANSGYLGTYGLWLGASSAPSGTNTVTVTVTQKENGTAVATSALTVNYTGAGLAGRLIPVGLVTLPLRATPGDNTLTSYTFAVNHTAGTDTYSDILLTDTRGQTIIAVPPTAVPTVYVDEPSALQSAPNVYASASSLDRTQAYGIMDVCWITGGPVLFEPGSNKLMVWADAAAPTATATYYPRWPFDRAA